MIDEAELWLKNNDPKYRNYKNRREAEYPFHTNWQEYHRKSKEVAVSSFTGRHTRRISLGNGNYKIDTKERPIEVLEYLK